MDDPVQAAESVNNYGNTLYGLQQYGNAIHSYTRAIEICPQIAKYYGNRAACYLMMNEYIKALSDSKKSVELDKGFKKGYLRLGKCCIAIGDMRYGENILSKAKGIFPDDKDIVEIYENIKYIEHNQEQYNKKMELKQYEEALQYIENCIIKAPQCIKYHTNKGKCLICLQKFEEAEKIADDILKYKASDEDALFIKSSVKIYQEDLDKALEISKELKKKLPDHPGTIKIFRNTTMLHKNNQDIKNALKEKKYVLAYDILTKTIKIDEMRKILNKKLLKQKIEIVDKDKTLLWNGVADCTKYMLLYGINKEILNTRIKFNTALQEYEDVLEDLNELNKLENSNDIKKKIDTIKKLLDDQLKYDYKILKISAKHTKEDIKKAASDLMKHYHVDKNPRTTPERTKLLETKFMRVREAQKRLLSKIK